MKLAQDRAESFKKFTTEKGSLFSGDPELKHYLLLPHLLQTLPKDDILLEELLSDDFPIKLLDEIMVEIDGIIFYTMKIAPNRSFLTKAFEYGLKYDPRRHTGSTEQIYYHIRQNIEEHSKEVDQLEKENQELDELTARVQSKFDSVKSAFINMNMEEEARLNKPQKVHGFHVFSYSPASSEQRFVDWEWKDMFGRLKAVRQTLSKQPTSDADMEDQEEARSALARMIHSIRKPDSIDPAII